MSEKDSPDTGECQYVSYHLPQWDEKGKCSWNDLQLQHKSLNAQAKCIVPPIKVIPVICSVQLNQDTFLKEFCSYSMGGRSPLAV